MSSLFCLIMTKFPDTEQRELVGRAEAERRGKVGKGLEYF